MLGCFVDNLSPPIRRDSPHCVHFAEGSGDSWAPRQYRWGAAEWRVGASIGNHGDIRPREGGGCVIDGASPVVRGVVSSRGRPTRPPSRAQSMASYP